MKILFDQGTPAPLRRALAGHIVVTAFEKGWSNTANGDLIRAAEAEDFALLITTDKNWPALQPHEAKIAAAATAMQPAEFRELDPPE